MRSIDYPIPPYGLGTDFSQYQRPLTFAEVYTNRFRNINGSAERRPGMSKLMPAINGAPNLTRLHEWVSKTGEEVIFSSDNFGNIYKFNTATSAWNTALSGRSPAKNLSIQAEDKLIFYNGVDRNIYTNDGGTTFNELKAIITKGTLAGGSNATTVIDGDITNWIGSTNVANNDIIHNVTLNAYGIVSTVASAQLTITAIGSAATGAGLASRNQQAGDVYELIDYVDSNVVPQANGISDNVATAGVGTTAMVVAVSGVNFASAGQGIDFVYNTTRSAIAAVTAVSANINLQQSISGQTSGDALVFFKTAMPIADWIHVHYGRVYYLDARNKRDVVISAPDDPEDLTTYQKTLDASSFSFGTQQPTGDVILSMSTFQGYFVAAGKKNLYIYKGNTPISDTSSTTVDFVPTAFYPNGIVSRFGLATNGSDLLHVTTEGLQAVNIGNISNTTIQSNASVPIRQTILDLILQTNSENIQLTHYPRRTWSILKIGDVAYILNTNPSYNDAGELVPGSSWHLFSGKWAQQNHYFVRRNGDLLACGMGGLVYKMDNEDATDDGQVISTDLTTAWLRLEEPQKTVRIKQGQYIKPIFESGGNLSYTINAVAGWDNFSSDSIIVSAGNDGAIGSAIVGTTPIGAGFYAQGSKYPLRWRGEQVRIQFTTQSSALPDIITGFTLYGEIFGIR